MRNYLETFLFYSARAKRHVACENILLRSGRKVRAMVEGSVVRLLRPEIVPYPGKADLPLEIEANRVVVERLLGRPVQPEEVLPNLQGNVKADGAYWICAPVTNLASKVYPFERWADIFRNLAPDAEGKRIFLVGVKSDAPKLQELLNSLHGMGLTQAEIRLPEDLAAFVRLIAGAELMLSVDTAAAHFATALNRPTVVLFSGLHLGMFGPWRRGVRQAWLLPEFPDESPKKRKWHAGIPPARAAASARSVLHAHESCSQ